jgi:hypothetical protein
LAWAGPSLQSYADRAGKGASTPPLVLATLIMSPMTPEVDPDDNYSCRRIEELLVGEVVELLLDECVADRLVDTNEQAAARHAVTRHLDFDRRVASLICRLLTQAPITPDSQLGQRLQRLGASPGPALDRLIAAIGASPGAALERLGWELADLEKGIVGPMVSKKPLRGSTPDKTGTIRGKRPPQTTKVQMLQAEVAGTMQLLMLAGRRREDAAKEAAGKLKGHKILTGIKGAPWRTIAGWRAAISAGSVSPAAIQHYNSFLTESDRLIEVMGTDRKAALVKIAHYKLQHLEPPPEQPKKSGPD